MFRQTLFFISELANRYFYIVFSLCLGLIFLGSPWLFVPISTNSDIRGALVTFLFWKTTSTLSVTGKCFSLNPFLDSGLWQLGGWLLFLLQVGIWIGFWLTNRNDKSADSHLAKRMSFILLILATGIFVLMGAEPDCQFQSLTNSQPLITDVSISWQGLFIALTSIFSGVFALQLSRDIKRSV